MVEKKDFVYTISVSEDAQFCLEKLGMLDYKGGIIRQINLNIFVSTLIIDSFNKLGEDNVGRIRSKILKKELAFNKMCKKAGWK